jgi:hypothetical protein
MDRRTRREVLGLVAGGTVAVSGCLGSEEPDSSRSGSSESDSSSANSSDGVDWQNAELKDVTTGETFTIAGLAAPVLVHPFAIWCSTCGRQNRELDSFQETNDHEIVQLNIGDGENTNDVVDYAEENGYADHSRFAVTPNSVSKLLVEEFGPQAVSPPQSPVILVCPDGNIHEFTKVSAPETLESGIETHCG